MLIDGGIAQNSGDAAILSIITKFRGLLRESCSFGCTFQVEMNLIWFWFGLVWVFCNTKVAGVFVLFFVSFGR